MSRRVVVVLVILLGLIGGRLVLNRGIHPVSAAHDGGEATIAPPAQPAASAARTTEMPNAATESSGEAIVATQPASERSVAVPSSPAAQDGVTEVDPHKAFGSKTASIIMEVFSDYQCPSCKAFYTSTNRQLMENYVSTGKVYLIHRDFPLQMHAYSRVAARYARAAAEIGKIEPVEKALYDNQEKWEQTGDVDGTLAGALSSADMTKIRSLVKGGTLDPLIDKDYQLGMGYRVGSTPTTVFHYKGQTYPYSGGMSYDMLRQFLDQLLNQK